MWFWKCWLCLYLVSFSCHCSATPGRMIKKMFLLYMFFFPPSEWVDTMRYINAFRSGRTNRRLFITPAGGAQLLSVNSCFDFIGILLRFLRCGKMLVLWPVLGANDLIGSSLTPHCIYLRAQIMAALSWLKRSAAWWECMFSLLSVLSEPEHNTKTCSASHFLTERCMINTHIKALWR